MRLDEYIKTKYDMSRSKAQKLNDDNLILVNGEHKNNSYIVEDKDVIELIENKEYVPSKFKGENMPKDANGTELNAGDNVTLIKDLKVKGAGATLKRGTMVKNIKLTDDDKEIEGKIDKMGVIVLKTEFLKKA